jgi:antitoxin VapB
MERIPPMNTAKIFRSGNSRAVRLPKGFQLEGIEVYVKRVGRGLLLMPNEDPWASLSDFDNEQSFRIPTGSRVAHGQLGLKYLPGRYPRARSS